MMYIFIYQKLDNWIMQFKSFHWLTHYGLWVIIPYACIKTVTPEAFSYIVTFSLFLQNIVGKIDLYMFRAFFGFNDCSTRTFWICDDRRPTRPYGPRWPSIIAYPTRTRRIIVY